MTTTRPITAFYSFLSTSQSSEIENETVNGKETEAATMECENGKLHCFVLLILFPEKC